MAASAGVPNIVTFDMGGTSTDVALIQDGEPVRRTSGKVHGRDVLVPMLDIHTVAAGGGTLAWLDVAGGLQVGPQSAGAQPGPACYGRGGTQPTVTDANVVLGLLSGDNALAGGTLVLDRAAAERSDPPRDRRAARHHGDRSGARHRRDRQRADGRSDQGRLVQPRLRFARLPSARIRRRGSVACRRARAGLGHARRHRTGVSGRIQRSRPAALRRAARRGHIGSRRPRSRDRRTHRQRVREAADSRRGGSARTGLRCGAIAFRVRGRSTLHRPRLRADHSAGGGSPVAERACRPAPALR